MCKVICTIFWSFSFNNSFHKFMPSILLLKISINTFFSSLGFLSFSRILLNSLVRVDCPLYTTTGMLSWPTTFPLIILFIAALTCSLLIGCTSWFSTSPCLSHFLHSTASQVLLLNVVNKHRITVITDITAEMTFYPLRNSEVLRVPLSWYFFRVKIASWGGSGRKRLMYLQACPTWRRLSGTWGSDDQALKTILWIPYAIASQIM